MSWTRTSPVACAETLTTCSSIEQLRNRAASLREEIEAYDEMNTSSRDALAGITEQLRGASSSIQQALAGQSTPLTLDHSDATADADSSADRPAQDTPAPGAGAALNPKASTFEPTQQAGDTHAKRASKRARVERAPE